MQIKNSTRTYIIRKKYLILDYQKRDTSETYDAM